MYTKTIYKRNIGLSEENIEILLLWTKIQADILGTDHPLYFPYGNDRKVPQKGNTNTVLRAISGESVIWGDGGNGWTMPGATISLNQNSYLFAEQFEIEFNGLARELGYNSDIDKDLVVADMHIQKPISLIKHIFVYILTNILKPNGEINNEANKYYQIFSDFHGGLQQLGVARKDLLTEFFSQTGYTHLILKLGAFISEWSLEIDKIIKSIAELNEIKNTIETAQKAIKNIKTDLMRHLCYRLAVARGDVLLDSTLKSNGWVVDKLNALSEAILINTDIDEKKIVVCERDFLIDVEKFFSHRELICFVLQDHGRDITWINKLYDAIYEVQGMDTFISLTAHLMSDWGSILFMADFYNTTNLNRRFIDCIQKAKNACDDPMLKETPLVLTATNIPKLFKDAGDLSKLGNTQFKEKTKNRMMLGLTVIALFCKKMNWNDTININVLHKLANFPAPTQTSSTTPPTLPVDEETTKHIGTESNSVANRETTSLPPSNRQPTSKPNFLSTNLDYVLEEDKTIFSKDCIFNLLEIDRFKTLNQLAVLLETDLDLQKMISREAIAFYDNKLLPQAMLHLLSPDEEIHVNVAQMVVMNLFDSICLFIRKEAKKQGGYQEILSLNNKEFVTCLVKNKSPLLSLFKEQFNEYEENYMARQGHLMEVCLKPAIACAYFKYHYLDEKDGIRYTPNQPGLFHKILQMNKIPVQIWQKNKDGVPELLESFNIQSVPSKLRKNLLIINQEMGFTLFQPVSFPDLILKKDNSLLKTVLAQVMNVQNNQLTSDQKISVLDFFCTEYAEVAESGWSSAIGEFKEIQSNLYDYQKELDLHEIFITEGKKFVFEKIAQTYGKAKENYKFNKQSDLRQLKKTIATAVDTFIDLEVKDIFQDYKKLTEKKGLSTTLFWEGNNYWVREESEENAVNNQLQLYRKSEGSHYLNDTSQLLAFNEINLNGDDQPLLSKMGIYSKNILVRQLIEAIKNEDGRQMLKLDIYGHLFEIYRGKYQDGQLMTTKVKGWLQSMLEAEQTKLDGLVKKYQKRILDYCAEEKTCLLFIKKYEALPCIRLRKFSAKLCAQQMQMELIIYDKNSSLYTEVSWMTESELTDRLPNPTKTVCVLLNDSAKGCYLSLIEPEIQEENSPAELGQNYEWALKEQLKNSIPLPGNQELLAGYLQTINTSSEHPALLTLMDKIDPLDVENICVKLSRKELIELEFVNREEKRKAWDQPTTSYIEGLMKTMGCRFDALEDLAILVDEPLNDKKQTLLLKSVEQKDVSLIDFLLARGASVVVKSLTEFNLEFMPQAHVTTNSTYVLEKEKEKWILHYRDDLWDESRDKLNELINIDEVNGLTRVLNEFNNDMDDAKCKETVIGLLEGYHNTVHFTTPVLFAARHIGFYDKDYKSCFFTLLKSGVKEADPRSKELASFDLLKKLSEDVLTPQMTKHLKDYIGKQETIRQTTFASFKRQFAIWFNCDRSKDRAEELAKLLQILIDTEINHDYREALISYEHVLHCGKQAKDSALHQGLRTIKDQLSGVILLPSYGSQYNEYKLATQKSKNNVGESHINYEKTIADLTKKQELSNTVIAEERQMNAEKFRMVVKNRQKDAEKFQNLEEAHKRDAKKLQTVDVERQKDREQIRELQEQVRLLLIKFSQQDSKPSPNSSVNGNSGFGFFAQSASNAHSKSDDNSSRCNPNDEPLIDRVHIYHTNNNSNYSDYDGEKFDDNDIPLEELNRVKTTY